MGSASREQAQLRGGRLRQLCGLLFLVNWLHEVGLSADGPDFNRRWAEIRVIDRESKRGVPLVELETVNGLRFVTDNAGRIAFCEPGLLDREVFFHLRSHGYEGPKDGFGFVGVRITPSIGKPVEIEVSRQNMAERLCRLTGEGRYRDSLLLGHRLPLPESPHPGLVAGQDSVQAAIHRGRIYWFWGDTERMNYPLGLFRMAGATTAIPSPDDASSDPVNGFAYDYFVDPQTGFARAMMPLPERPEGVVWVESVFVAPDEQGADRLVGGYSRRQGLATALEQGIAVFDDEQQIFKAARQVPLSETWRMPKGPPIVLNEAGRNWLLFGSPSPNVRVPATLSAVLDPSAYEALTCIHAESRGEPWEPDLGPDGRPNWRWQRTLPPTDSEMEHHWIQQGRLKSEYARFCPRETGAGSTCIQLHRGSVRWNDFLQKWILIAGQFGGKESFLGEIWYSEADAPTGPFPVAVKIVTHRQQTFYNVVQHAFLDRNAGRTIHFEGTYTNEFSGNSDKTPRYNYNQVLYRLALDNPRLSDWRAANTRKK
ncbi:MAG: hypothetical protein SFV23_18395 [Planctomycetaceae bacterium]|nr:hypothetical protein [Planctomycetaceae bacterium]